MSIERDRRLAEKEVREVVADAESPLAQKHVRESLKKNKFALVAFGLVVAVPALLLLSFYGAKVREIRAKFRDPYALPEGFNPKTGEFAGGTAEEARSASATAAPRSLMLGGGPGQYSSRAKRLAESDKEVQKSTWWR